MIVPQGGAGAVVGQNTLPDDASDNASNADIVVIGSSIRGVAPVGSSLIGVSSDTIAAVAATNVKEVLATVPALSNFQTNAEQSTPSRFHTTGYIPNIHNLGPIATLTLINGHRVTDTGTEGTFADPSTIPPIALQRVEIVADDASAIYGADAVAGVVNFIFRKPFNGVEAQSTYSFDGETRYRRIEASIIGGKTWDGGGFMAAYTYSDNRSPLALEIPKLALGGDQRSNGGRDLRVTNCQTPTIRAVTATGGPTGTTYGSAERNFRTTAADLRCGRNANVGIIPDGQRHAALATFEQQITDTCGSPGELNYGYNDAQVEEQRGGISVLVNRGTPSFNAQNIPPPLFNNPAVTRVSASRSSVGLLSRPTPRSASRRSSPPWQA